MKQQLRCNRTISFNSFFFTNYLLISFSHCFWSIWYNGGVLCLYVWIHAYMHECMYISVFMYVEVHAYMCIRLANAPVNVKRKQISWFVVRKISTFYIEARLIFYRGYKFYWDSCLGCLVPKADDIFLFQRLKKISHKFGKFRQHGEHASVSMRA